MTQRINKKPAIHYHQLYKEVSLLLHQAKEHTYQTVNSVLTATYWHIGRQIIEFEQKGQKRAEYGEALLKKLAKDLTNAFGRGFSRENLRIMKKFYFLYKKTKSQTVSGIFEKNISFPLSWSHYIKLISIEDDQKRLFYEKESLRARWSVRQLDRQINTALYERSLLSNSIKKSDIRQTSSNKQEISFKDPYILEFLNLPQTHSERDLESSLITHMSDFLLELGFGFTFVARQKRLQIGSESFYIDLLLYHRQLRCFVVIDLKIGRFSHSDVGQMNLYLNYLNENERMTGENPPIGLILCTEKDDAVVHYAIGGLSNKVFASRYKLMLPKSKMLEKELKKECLHLKNT